MENCIVNSVEVEVEKPWLTKKNLKEQKKRFLVVAHGLITMPGTLGLRFYFLKIIMTGNYFHFQSLNWYLHSYCYTQN